MNVTIRRFTVCAWTLLLFVATACGSKGYTGNHGSSREDAASEASDALDSLATSRAAPVLKAAVARFAQRPGFNSIFLQLRLDTASFLVASPANPPSVRSPLAVIAGVGLEDLAASIAAGINERLRTIVGTNGGSAVLDVQTIAPPSAESSTLILSVYATRLPDTFQTTSTPDYACNLYQFRLAGSLKVGTVELPIDVTLPAPDQTAIAMWQRDLHVMSHMAQNVCVSRQTGMIEFAHRQINAALFKSADEP